MECGVKPVNFMARSPLLIPYALKEAMAWKSLVRSNALGNTMMVGKVLCESTDSATSRREVSSKGVSISRTRLFQ